MNQPTNLDSQRFFLATDETQIEHGFEFDNDRYLSDIRVSSVFHPWLKTLGVAARPHRLTVNRR
jgi:hypothetical protein